MPNTQVSIVDYGLGNLGSVESALRAVGASVRVVNTPSHIRDSHRLVLPGVGSFRAGALGLTNLGLEEALLDVAGKGVPILGICLGMQLLATYGVEGGRAEGLGLIPGKVTPFNTDSGLRIPHMGFNEVSYIEQSLLFNSIPERSDFYFVHSYHFVLDNPGNLIGQSTYGMPFTAAVQQNNVMGTQFHPEKSQGQGLRLLYNFSRLL